MPSESILDDYVKEWLLRGNSNSAIALILRLYGQQTFNFQQTDSREPTVHAYFARLIGLNVLIAGLHLYFQTLHPGEATRGYAHGGLILDFIGQKGPSSKMQLVLYDFVILVLQLIYLDVFRARRTLAQKQSTIVRSNGRREATQPTDRAPTIQELDAEERGAIQQEDESEILHDSGLTFDASDMLYSGQADLGTFYLFKVMKEKLQMTGTPGFRDGPSVLSNIVRDDIRRRRYTFDIPFRNWPALGYGDLDN